MRRQIFRLPLKGKVLIVPNRRDLKCNYLMFSRNLPRLNLRTYDRKITLFYLLPGVKGGKIDTQDTVSGVTQKPLY